MQNKKSLHYAQTHILQASRIAKDSFVEMPGVEPGSGEGINRLSTCLSKSLMFLKPTRLAGHEFQIYPLLSRSA